MMSRKVTLSILALIFAACGGSEKEPSTEDNGKDRTEILTHWVDHIIVPSYESFESKFAILKSEAATFVETPDHTSLQDLRAAWADAYIEWQNVELFEFGPADQYTLRNFFNIYPANVEGISAAIEDGNVNLDVPSAYPKQGFPALDYLLNGTGSNDDEILSYFTDDVSGTKRLDYLSTLISRMDNRLNNVIGQWKGTYRDTFISRTGLDIGSSMGAVVNAYVLHFERYIRSGKVGIPSGAMVSSNGNVYPDKVEAFYKSDMSKTLAKTANQAAHDFFIGKTVDSGEEGPSFKSYLDALDAKDKNSGTLLSTLIAQQFTTIDQELDKLSENFSEEVIENNDQMNAVFNEMQKMVRMLKVDMTSAMSVTITYTDNDGD